MTAFKPRRPSAPPSAADLAERDAFQALSTASLDSVRKSAETWRNGLTAFITLVTTGIVIKGRDTTAAMDAGWRVAVTVLIGTGLVCSVLGLWQTLGAQAGTRRGPLTLADVHRHHSSVAAYKVALAATTARRLRNARVLVALALTLLLSGVAVTWWAPAPSSSPTAYLQVQQGTTTTCGTLESADQGVIRLKLPGTSVAGTFPLTTVTNFKIVSSCAP